MAEENIKFPRAHMAIRDGYFYYCDERNDTLNMKTCYGDTSFVYPFDVPLGSNQVRAMEYDGHFFWTMQNGTTSDDRIIKKWVLDNYVCKLVDTIDLSETVDNTFRCPTFALEYYNTTLAADFPDHSTTITLNSYINKIEPGTILTVGPNEEGLYEDVTVTGTIDNGKLGLDFYNFNSYSEGTEVYFPKNLWLVNDYTYTAPGGSLYRYSLITDRVESVIEDEDFEYVEACCFYNSTELQYVLCVVGTNLRFLDTESETNITSMIIDNREPNSTEIPVYDIKTENDTLYRLQLKGSYYGTSYSWSTYNYQVSTLRSFVDSVAISVSPKILPSNGINVAEITVSVRDQYNDPVQIKPVLLSDSDPVGFITTAEAYTNLLGVATSYYKAGTSPATVTISAKATQYD